MLTRRNFSLLAAVIPFWRPKKDNWIVIDNFASDYFGYQHFAQYEKYGIWISYTDWCMMEFEFLEGCPVKDITDIILYNKNDNVVLGAINKVKLKSITYTSPNPWLSFSSSEIEKEKRELIDKITKEGHTIKKQFHIIFKGEHRLMVYYD